MPAIRVTNPEATYLLWLDCRGSGLTGSPFDFFRKEGKVALSDGKAFGLGRRRLCTPKLRLYTRHFG